MVSTTTEEVWDCLDGVPDPEIPVVSVVDLGIVRGVELFAGEAGQGVTVRVTPTYTGCPASAVIASDIRSALTQVGFTQVKIETELLPAWTTDWISAKGREALTEYGIAPPVGEAACGAPAIPAAVNCPACKSSNTVCVSRFGSTPCKAHFRCDDCLEPFDYFKCL
jgi:ring-1,2-phenylacetyl-CoA epoxidase subunit PaaD